MHNWENTENTETIASNSPLPAPQAVGGELPDPPPARQGRGPGPAHPAPGPGRRPTPRRTLRPRRRPPAPAPNPATHQSRARARPGLWPLTAHPERVSLPSRSGTRLPAPGLGGLSRKLGGPTKVDKSEVLLQCDK